MSACKLCGKQVCCGHKYCEDCEEKIKHYNLKPAKVELKDGGNR